MKNFSIPASLLQIVLVAVLFVSCSKVPMPIALPEKPIVDTVMVTEPFEWNEKTDYDNAMLPMQSGQWIFSNALLGATTSDKKNQTQSVRMIGAGSVNMAWSINLGTATKVKVFAALYGTSSASRWVLLASNNGSAYTKVGDTITTSTTTLDSVVFNYTKTGWTSFAIQKADGAGILNFDNFTITTKTPTFSAYYIAPPSYVTFYNTPVVTPPTAGLVGKDSTQYPVSGDNSNLLMGNPSNATVSEVSPNNYLLVSRYYTASYSRDRGAPNWVSWHLMKSNYGTVSRTDNYQPNTILPSGWYRVSGSSYNGSGYSRGHNCPSGDRTSSLEANYSVFLMTNMIPQASGNNGGVWNNFENYTRSLADAGNECYVIMGSYGNKGTIDNGHIVIPTNIWKVVVVLTNGNSDLSRVTSSTRVICINTPNTEDANSDWKTYRVSLNDIEAATGYSLLSTIDPAVKQVVASKVDNL